MEQLFAQYGKVQIQIDQSQGQIDQLQAQIQNLQQVKQNIYNGILQEQQKEKESVQKQGVKAPEPAKIEAKPKTEK
ncbi:conjugal transfer/entry exclusion protein [Sporomusaceae bacterium BoRhaA]|uniref:hypothetical protein n=1 Tax=Pelorhabdus rhamnosifermentans TaxID=2772457 RepID=UPI001C06073D|nr:hypothetical protein [Pelorhabdus rhamnosifermentans]MBU2704151.1 conjugal transfer/entry exclusion protein [Pelorhabdus rhamnosifermentans]